MFSCWSEQQTNPLLSFPELLGLSQYVSPPPPFLTAHYTVVGCVLTMVWMTGWLAYCLFCHMARKLNGCLDGWLSCKQAGKINCGW